MKYKLKVWNSISWLFGILVFIDGLLNIFWGNDFGLGIAFILISVIYFPPINEMLKTKFGFTIPPWMKISLGFIILWITGAVGAIAEGYV